MGPAHAEAILEKAEVQAKRRVLFFFLAFIVSGFFSECVPSFRNAPDYFLITTARCHPVLSANAV